MKNSEAERTRERQAAAAAQNEAEESDATEEEATNKGEHDEKGAKYHRLSEQHPSGACRSQPVAATPGKANARERRPPLEIGKEATPSASIR